MKNLILVCGLICVVAVGLTLIGCEKEKAPAPPPAKTSVVTPATEAIPAPTTEPAPPVTGTAAAPVSK